MISKLLISAVVVAVAAAARLPSTSYGTPNRGQTRGGFRGTSSGGHSLGQASHGGAQGVGVGGGGGGAFVSSASHGGTYGGAAAGGFQRAPAGGGFVGGSQGIPAGGSYRPSSGPVIPILVDERDGPHADGTYSFNFETGNGISRQEQGYPQGPNGAVVSQGGWSFTFPDGTPGVFNFVADENGYRVESDLIPTPHPLPAHAIEQIEFARRQKEQGITYDGQGRGTSQGFRGTSGGSYSTGGQGGSFSSGGQGGGSYSTGRGHGGASFSAGGGRGGASFSAGGGQGGSFVGTHSGGVQGAAHSTGFTSPAGGYSGSHSTGFQGSHSFGGSPAGGSSGAGVGLVPRPAPRPAQRPSVATPSRTYGYP